MKKTQLQKKDLKKSTAVQCYHNAEKNSLSNKNSCKIKHTSFFFPLHPQDSDSYFTVCLKHSSTLITADLTADHLSSLRWWVKVFYFQNSSGWCLNIEVNWKNCHDSLIDFSKRWVWHLDDSKWSHSTAWRQGQKQWTTQDKLPFSIKTIIK